MRFETKTTAFVFVGSPREHTNARVEDSVYARFLPGICARVWHAVHSCMAMLQGRHVPALQPVLCLSAPSIVAYPCARSAARQLRMAVGPQLG